MPYISREDRKHLESCEFPPIDNLAEDIRHIPSGKVGGALNYTICRLACLSMRPEEGWSYASLSEVIGHVESAAAELRKRLLNPYEEYAKHKNGDVEELADIEREHNIFWGNRKDPQGNNYDR